MFRQILGFAFLEGGHLVAGLFLTWMLEAVEMDALAVDHQVGQLFSELHLFFLNKKHAKDNLYRSVCFQKNRCTVVVCFSNEKSGGLCMLIISQTRLSSASYMHNWSVGYIMPKVTHFFYYCGSSRPQDSSSSLSACRWSYMDSLKIYTFQKQLLSKSPSFFSG